ncbi:ATP-binding cassette domain-containing protein [Tropicibacter sp. R16_0]|uniref:ATP-binding cassette domain-containing protein n=1 Tax=Tropicibacter sp. R16_0 TaxID=2821102 RepID=UPI001ADA08EB|nr:ATP-binding cassette domain-containing protein [Tropicibacter sp. R16_0]MBO9452092.1 ATP-binding cassette domain-containing protein [Tropicibacter sp. R16_0]
MRDFSVMTDHPTLSVRGLSIVRDGKALLGVDYLDLDGPGPTIILGPNGAGKSLLLRCLHGLITPDRGTVTQGGQVLTDKVRAGQAMVFQRPVLLRRTVAGNLDFVLRRRGLSRSARRAECEELLAQGGLSDKARQSARSLSGGEAQRLAILRALACKPSVLFLDEPTSALDPQATQEIEQMVLRASDQGLRVVMVTHDIGQARRLARDVVVMHGGRVVEQGLAAQMFAAPQSGMTRRFLSGGLMV